MDLDNPYVNAAATLAAALAAAWVVNWLAGRELARFVARMPGGVPGDEAAVRTRWSTLRRAIVATIIVVGILAAALNFEATQTFAQAALASSALIAIVLGLASQSTLSNAVAGLVLAFSQPIRLGDRVRIDGYAGVVELIGLTYTSLRADDGRRIVFPNTLLFQKTIENLTTGGGAGRVLVRVPVRTGGDADAVRERLLALASEAGVEEAEAVVAELVLDGPIVELRGLTPGYEDARRAEEHLRAGAAAVVAEQGA